MGKNIPDYTLDHPVVRAVKAKYINNHKRSPHDNSGCKLSFDELFERFRKNESFNSLHVVAGIERHRLRQKWKKYFQQFFGESDGFERRKKLAMRVRVVRKEVLANQTPDDEVMKSVFEEAKKHGCKVKQVLTFHNTSAQFRANKRHVMVNWHLCQVRSLESTYIVRPHSKPQTHIHTRITRGTLKKVHALIIRIATPGSDVMFFVLPSCELEELLFKDSTHPWKDMYFPIEFKKTIVGRRVRKMWKYRDAWHLLSPQELKDVA